MWVVNMIVCCSLAFAGFAYAIYLMIKADDKKRASAKQKVV